MQDVYAWLNGDRDFSQGAELYGKYGRNSFFKELLTAGPTPYNIKKLQDELRALCGDATGPRNPSTACQESAVNRQQLAVADQVPTHQAAPLTTDHSQLTAQHEKYLQLQSLKNTRYRQLERNMAMLDLEKREDVLHATAKQILSLHSQIENIWKQIDYYDEHGRFPEVKAPVKRSATQEIQLLRQSTSKAKARLKSGKCRDLAGTQKLIEENTAKIKELMKEVKG